MIFSLQSWYNIRIKKCSHIIFKLMLIKKALSLTQHIILTYIVYK